MTKGNYNLASLHDKEKKLHSVCIHHHFVFNVNYYHNGIVVKVRLFEVICSLRWQAIKFGAKGEVWDGHGWKPEVGIGVLEKKNRLVLQC